MLKRCVAANCDSTYKDGVSLFRFPKDPVLRREWVRQVRRTRADWNEPALGTVNPSCVLCSCHFTADCFDTVGHAVKLSLGFARRQKHVLSETAATAAAAAAAATAAAPGDAAAATAERRRRRKEKRERE